MAGVNRREWPGRGDSWKDIVSQLVSGTDTLRQLNLDPATPPAFLLDSRRMAVQAPAPGQFDNRWVVFPQDFPSAVFLRAQQIERVLLLHRSPTTADPDLTMVMKPWKQAGLQVLAKNPLTTRLSVETAPPAPAPLDIPPPARLSIPSRLFFLLV